MADNLGVSTGTDATVRTKDNAGVHLNVSAIVDETGATFAPVTAAGVKVDLGADNDVSVSNGAGAAAVNIQDGGNSITVDGPLTDAQLRATHVPVSITDGTNTVATIATGPSLNVNLRTINGATPSTNTGAVGAGVQRVTLATDVALPAGNNNIGDVDVLTVPAPLSTTGGGTEATALRVTVANDSTGVLSVDDNGGSLTVDGTVAISGTANVNITGVGVNLPVTGIDAIDTPWGDNALEIVSRASTATPTAVSTDGDHQAIWLDRNGRVQIGDGGQTISVDDGAGSLTVDGSVTATLAAGTNTNEVVGDVAHDAAAAGNPVLVAASAETMADTAPTNRVSADGDATRLSATDGALYVVTTGPQSWSYHVNGSAALTDATVHAAPGAGLSLYVQTIVVSLGAASALNVFFKEGASTVLGPYYLEAVNGRTLVINFTCPKKITANTALTVTSSAAVAHAIDVTGFIAPG